MKRVFVITAALLAAHAAAAAPHGSKARSEFERGAKAYQKQDYAGASEAFAASWRDEQDVETLFAWAQAERLQDHCKAAIELYRKLDNFTLNPENRQLITSKRKECQAILAQQKPEPEPDPEPEPEPDHTPPQQHAKPDPEVDTPPPDVEPPHVHKRAHREPSRHWYADPAGDTLSGLGVVGLGVGVGYLVVSYNDSNSHQSGTYNDAKPDGKLGVEFAGVGAALLATGLLRYALMPSDPAAPAVTGWATPTGGGLAVLGSF